MKLNYFHLHRCSLVEQEVCIASESPARVSLVEAATNKIYHNYDSYVLSKVVDEQSRQDIPVQTRILDRDRE